MSEEVGCFFTLFGKGQKRLKAAAEKKMGVFCEVTAWGSPSLETRDDHDRESACSAQSSNKQLARIYNKLSSILFANIRFSNFTAQARSLPTSSECFSENTSSDTFGSAHFFYVLEDSARRARRGNEMRPCSAAGTGSGK